jgi:TonB family protein
VGLLAALMLAFAPSIASAQPIDAGVGPPASPPPADAPTAPAATDAPAAPSSPAPPAGQPQFEPPHPLTSTDVPYPADAPPIAQPVIVTVKLRIDPTGAVVKVDVVTPPQAVFDDAVIAAVKAFRFDPGRYGGKPVPVEITFTHTFLPPPPPPPPTAAEQGPARTSVLRGKLVELGTRAPVESATINVDVAGHTYSTEGDAKGHFRIELPPGTATIHVYAPAHNPFLQQETLAAHQELQVSYFVERDRYDPYEIVIVGEQKREEVSRITLRGPEIQQVPGTFGDPFRVVQALPGVSSVVSLLPFPVVRGSSPSATGFEIDGIRVPLLFHLLAGPSVIHPEFIDQIDFYPGGAPAPYGGYTGGIIDGRTVRADQGSHLIDVDLNLLQVGGLVREPIAPIDATMTVAARYGFPGLLLSLVTNQFNLAYWDYQFRLDGGTKANGWTVFVFGAKDELDTIAANANPNAANPPLTPALELAFHRVDLRYHQTIGKLETTYRLVGGFDRTFSNGIDFWVWSLDPSIRSRYHYDKQLDLAAGVDGDWRDLRQGAQSMQASTNPISTITDQLSTSYSVSAYVEALWRPTRDWLIRPGVRADVYSDATATKPDLDPRLTVRYRLKHVDSVDFPADSDESSIWLKGSVGVYHQPPRFVLPLPGLDEMPLKYGLQEATQTSLGIEMPLPHRFTLSTEGYFNYMDPTLFDLSTNALSVGTNANSSVLPTSVITGNATEQQIVQRLTTPELGRAYGVEFLLRRQAKSGLYGWIAYTLSRSERFQSGQWVPYDYDRTHLLNLVAGLPLRRNWDIGLRVAYQSGLPETTTAGYNQGRGDGYVQFDIRVDKRAVWQKWLLDFYVDITNVALLPEEVEPGIVLRYVLPTVGLRGRF